MSAIEEELSKKTKATLKKKAEKRGFTPGSVYREYEKGLAAWEHQVLEKGCLSTNGLMLESIQQHRQKTGLLLRNPRQRRKNENYKDAPQANYQRRDFKNKRVERWRSILWIFWNGDAIWR